VQEWPFSAALSRIVTGPWDRIVTTIRHLSRRFHAGGVDAVSLSTALRYRLGALAGITMLR